MTIFDKILERQIPADVVYEDEWVLAFRDTQPQAPQHVLVIPKHKYQNFDELADQDPAAVGEYIIGVARAARELGLDKDGYRVVFNCGKNGQQTVEYIHAHILGERPMKWPPG